MANSVVAAGGSFGDRVKSWPERLKNFYSDVRTETKKVTAPSWQEVRSTTIVVIVAVFFFAAFFWIVDLTLTHSLDALYRYFAHR